MEESNERRKRIRRLLKEEETDTTHDDELERLLKEEECVLNPSKKSERDSDSMNNFVLSDDDMDTTLPIKEYTLRELLELVDDDDPFIVVTKRPNVPSPPAMTLLTFKIPKEIFLENIPERYEPHREKDKQNIDKFRAMVQKPRSEWGSTEFYKRLYNSMVINGTMLGRASRSQQNRKLLEQICSGRIQFLPSQPIPIEIRMCDGCGERHRILTYSFQIYDENGKEEKVIKMGNHCGEKIRILLEIFAILNTITLTTKEDEYINNALAMINYWTHRLMEVISDTNWRIREDGEEFQVEDLL